MSKDIHKDLVGIDYSKLRKHKRFDVKINCTLIDLKTKVKEVALLTTISAGGVTIQYPELMTKGDTYSIEFVMPNGSPVTKHIEIRWLDSEISKIDFEGSSRDGFEHGCKFILLNKNASSEVPQKIDQSKDAKEVPENLVNCYYHLEFYREMGNIIKHGYANKIGGSLLYFNTLADLRAKEKIAVNMIINDGGTYNEKKMSVEIISIKRNGKLYTIKGVKV